MVGACCGPIIYKVFIAKKPSPEPSSDPVGNHFGAPSRAQTIFYYFFGSRVPPDNNSGAEMGGPGTPRSPKKAVRTVKKLSKSALLAEMAPKVLSRVPTDP